MKRSKNTIGSYQDGSMSGIAYETNEINSYELVLFTQAQYPTMKKGGMEVIFDLPGHSKPLSGVCD